VVGSGCVKGGGGAKKALATTPPKRIARPPTGGNSEVGRGKKGAQKKQKRRVWPEQRNKTTEEIRRRAPSKQSRSLPGMPGEPLAAGKGSRRCLSKKKSKEKDPKFRKRPETKTFQLGTNMNILLRYSWLDRREGMPGGRVEKPGG